MNPAVKNLRFHDVQIYVGPPSMDFTVMCKDWLRESMRFHLTAEGQAIEDVSKIEFTDKGSQEIANNNLWMLGGNH
jgi:hypothetical protein